MVRSSIGSDVLHLLVPLAHLLVQVRPVPKPSSCQKVSFDILDAAFDLSFRPGPIGSAKPGLISPMAGKVLEDGVHHHRPALPPDHPRLRIVIEDRVRHSAKEGKGLPCPARR